MTQSAACMVKESRELRYLLGNRQCGSNNVKTLDQIHEAGECFSNVCDALTACDLLEDFEYILEEWAHRVCLWHPYCHTLKTYWDQFDCHELAGEKRDLLIAELLEKVNPADEKVYLIVLPIQLPLTIQGDN